MAKQNSFGFKVPQKFHGDDPPTVYDVAIGSEGRDQGRKP